MELGLGSNEVKLLPYTNEWKEEFNRVKLEIMDVTGFEGERIQHIGSTAIINMPAKPIIDILVGVDDKAKVDKALFNELKSIGFLRLRVERPGEIVFAKFTDDTYEVKTHFIHMVDFDKELWKNQLFFRDYLNSNDEARDEYQIIKITSAKQKDININTYTDLKEPFVKSIFTKRIN
ncbi:GrpB family protein [Psychrobacillus sp. INOP01]|uniref:GrpB family protein n=1 Tax=Psychrobacillus sp. INOP01 TaxID=2829187 RepID=UPI001BA47EB2|nr:GrpB family protein [Psychrobacillus sp. INOP01]QUG41626.1 GrpB family protein [Psychrobacillus sp. INOP01]